MLLVLPVGSIFASPQAPDQAPLPIKIGYQENTDWLLLVARDLKLFEKAGLAPTFVKFVAGPPMIAAAKEKSIDVTSIGSVPFLIGLAQGVDWVTIGVNPENAYGEGLVARDGSGIKTVADLRGKKIGYLRGSTAHFGLIMALYQLGIPRDQLTLINMTPAEQLAALASKEIDAAMVWEPWMQKMIHGADAKIIITEGEMGTYTAVTVYSARRDWLRDNRETALRYLRALLMAYEVLERKPEIGVTALADEMGIDESWAEIIYDHSPPGNPRQWTNPRYRYSLLPAGEFHRRLRYLARFLHDEQLYSQKVDVRNVMDVSLITEVLKTWKSGR
jgi:aliphatic sulfonates family ABC transporter substrate-binding protein